jgi:ribosomal protein L40E
MYQLEQSGFANFYVLLLWSVAIAAVIIFAIWFGPFHKAKSAAQQTETKRTTAASGKISDKQFCLECGSELPLGSKFCNKCGTKQAG